MPSLPIAELITAALFAFAALLLWVAYRAGEERARLRAAWSGIATAGLGCLAFIACYTGAADRWLAAPERPASAESARSPGAAGDQAGAQAAGGARGSGAGGQGTGAAGSSAAGGAPAGGTEMAAGGLLRPFSLAGWARASQSLLDTPPFRDCADCPEMQVLPAAYVVIGAVRGDGEANEAERPVAKVQHRRPFAIGRFEITIGQYRAFLAATGHAAPACTGGLAADPRLPVECVSHDDARAYVRWLSDKTFQRYRLPSASEWEYAARGGNGAIYPTGATLGERAAHAATGVTAPRPVGSYAANGFGLHDMAGNVAEIVRDCWAPTLARLPTDGSAAYTRGCSERTLKDGAWNEPSVRMRASARRPITSGVALPGIGFRVVREMGRGS